MQRLNTRNYIISSFLLSYRNGSDFSLSDPKPFFAKHEPLIKSRISESVIVLKPENKPVMVYEGIVPIGIKIVGFVILKDKVSFIHTSFQSRRRGIATEMFKVALPHLQDKSRIKVEFLTREGLRFFESDKAQALVPNGFTIENSPPTEG